MILLIIVKIVTTSTAHPLGIVQSMNTVFQRLSLPRIAPMKRTNERMTHPIVDRPPLLAEQSELSNIPAEKIRVQRRTSRNVWLSTIRFAIMSTRTSRPCFSNAACVTATVQDANDTIQHSEHMSAEMEEQRTGTCVGRRKGIFRNATLFVLSNGARRRRGEKRNESHLCDSYSSSVTARERERK